MTAAAPLSASLHGRLSVLMFLQFAVLGAWSVSFPTWLRKPPPDGGLFFSSTYLFWVYGSLAIGGLTAPVLNSILADRFFRCDRLIVVLNLLGAGLLALAATVGDHHGQQIRSAFDAVAASRGDGGVLTPAMIEQIGQQPDVQRAVDAAFPALFVLMLVYNVVAGMIAMTLMSTLCLRNMTDADRQYPPVRIWGTVAWIVVGVVVGKVLNEVSAQPLWFAAGVSLVLGFFGLTLPATPPAKAQRSISDTLGLPAAKMFTRGPLLVFAICSVSVTLLNSFYNIGFNLFLDDLKLDDPTALMTIGQVSEVVFLSLIPFGLRYVGLKWLMVLGIAGWFLRYLIFLTGVPWLIVAIGLPLHGFSHALFYIASMPFIDQQAPRHLRASAQGMLVFLSMGLGLLPGMWLASMVMGWCKIEGETRWFWVWTVPAVMAAVVLVLFTACFRIAKEPEPVEEIALPSGVEAGEPV